MKLALVLGFLVSCQALNLKQERRFPDDFIFGTATASYQIEGAWDVDGKGENIWDRMTHTQPEVITDRSNGDIAADSYHNYKRDVEMMRELGLDAYRFSLSWARILPSGFTNQINEPGVAFYNNYINEMLKYGIEPMITLYHWDLPQKLQDLGGFANPLIVDWFEDYARTAFELFGDRVKYWITFNEPREICYQGYGTITKAPILNSTGIGDYICAKYLNLAHAKAYHAYNNDFRPTQGGIIGTTVSINWYGPLTDSEEDHFAAELRRQAEWGLYTDPIFSAEGGFPKEISERIAQKSTEQGFLKSRLPEFTDEEKKFIQGTYDFLGINHYTSYLVSASEYKTVSPVPSMPDDVGVGTYKAPEWDKAASTWLTLSPNSLYNVVKYVSELYGNIPIYITENGWSNADKDYIEDNDRVKYYRAAWEDVLDALDEGIDIKGYMAWSLMDNFEWMEGYTLLAACSASNIRQERKFPDEFLFGTATASYQIEGGWTDDGKGESIWDRMTHTQPEVIKDRSNGDIAADSYHNYKRDVEMMRELGLDAYRFSLSWSRILPTGFSNQINQAGVDFYNNYIDEMLKYGITPMVTIYHWDLPQKLQDLGGFTNPLFTEWFEDYSRVVYELFGDRVKHWITFNEPREICYEGYGFDTKAPLLNAHGIGEYLCAKHLVLAHARAYHAYNNDFKPAQGGECGITISVNWFTAETDSEEDKLAAQLYQQSQWGIYAEPIFSNKGGWPEALEERVAQKSAEQGYSQSRLPALTDDEKALVRGAADFFGVNHYTGAYVSATKYLSSHDVPSLFDDVNAGMLVLEEWPSSASSWLKLMPNSLYNVLTDLTQRYNSPKLYVTENGWSDPPGGSPEDDMRITYYRQALEDVLSALEEGVQIKGYMAWSLMDNFEWMEGYTERFGLYEVDFTSPARTRTPRKSAFVYKQIIKSRVVDHSYEPDSRVMTIDEGH